MKFSHWLRAIAFALAALMALSCAAFAEGETEMVRSPGRNISITPVDAVADNGMAIEVVSAGQEDEATEEARIVLTVAEDIQEASFAASELMKQTVQSIAAIESIDDLLGISLEPDNKDQEKGNGILVENNKVLAENILGVYKQFDELNQGIRETEGPLTLEQAKAQTEMTAAMVYTAFAREENMQKNEGMSKVTRPIYTIPFCIKRDSDFVRGEEEAKQPDWDDREDKTTRDKKQSAVREDDLVVTEVFTMTANQKVSEYLVEGENRYAEVTVDIHNFEQEGIDEEYRDVVASMRYMMGMSVLVTSNGERFSEVSNSQYGYDEEYRLVIRMSAPNCAYSIVETKESAEMFNTAKNGAKLLSEGGDLFGSIAFDEDGFMVIKGSEDEDVLDALAELLYNWSKQAAADGTESEEAIGAGNEVLLAMIEEQRLRMADSKDKDAERRAETACALLLAGMVYDNVQKQLGY